LTLEVRPAAHQTALLVVEVRQLDLQPPFGRGSSLSEYLEDQPGAVDHLALELFFEIALLDRRQRTIDHDQLGFFEFAGGGDALDLPLAEQGRGTDLAYGHDLGMGDDEADRQRQALRFLEARLGVLLAPRAADVRIEHRRPRAAGDFADVVVEAQASVPSSSASSQSVVRSTGA